MADRSPGELRRRQAKRERQRQEYDRVMAPLRAAGAICATCEHFGRIPMDKRRCCDLDSDFHGYALVEATYLCLRYLATPQTKDVG